MEYRKIDVYDALVLLSNLLRVPKHNHVDADRTRDELISGLNARFLISKSLLESCLYYCQRNNDVNLFQHPEGESFDEFLDGLIKHWDKYDKRTGTLSRNRKKY